MLPTPCRANLLFRFDNLGEVIEKPRIDPREFINPLRCHAALERITQVPYALRTGPRKFLLDLFFVGLAVGSPQVAAVAAKTEATDLQTSQCFLKRFLERAADGHRLADAFHLRRECVVGLGEFFKRKPWNLRHDVVDGWLKTSGRLTSDVVGKLVQPIANREFCCDLRDRKAGCLRSERARTADPRIHFDDDHPTILRMNRELNVRPACFHADLANHRETGVTHALIFLVGKRLRGGYSNRIPGVDPHGIEILYRANDHDVVVHVAHHFHFIFFPTDDRFFDQHFLGGRGIETAADQFVVLLPIVGNRRTASPHREAGPHDGRQTNL